MNKFLFQSVENSVCILRNLSFRLEQEIDREKYKDAEPPKDFEKHEKESKFSARPGCMGKSAKKNKNVKSSRHPVEKKDLVFGAPLLWQPDIVRSYLTLLAESSNPETLEGASGAIHNLTASNWRVSVKIYLVYVERVAVFIVYCGCADMGFYISICRRMFFPVLIRKKEEFRKS